MSPRNVPLHDTLSMEGWMVSGKAREAAKAVIGDAVTQVKWAALTAAIQTNPPLPIVIAGLGHALMEAMRATGADYDQMKATWGTMCDMHEANAALAQGDTANVRPV